ncbi:MAG: hypothetical protein CL910_16010 [Deltaproteobacteria bacterium]|nr:hypothetical protein [Deltaproteobacteria bacterium]
MPPVMSRLVLACALFLAVFAAVMATWFLVRLPGNGYVAVPVGRSEPEGSATRPAMRSTEVATSMRRGAPTGGASEPIAGTALFADGSNTFTVEIAVRDPAGAGIGAARVQFAPPSGATTTTGRDGLARVRLPSGTRRIDVRADAEGYVHSRRRTHVAARVEVTLHRATSVRGRVVEKSMSVPLGGASVWLEDGHEGCESQPVTAGADGSFELAEVPVGTDFSVRASADGYADGRVAFQVLAGEPVESLELALERCAAVRLCFVDFQTWRPITGARLSNLRDLPPSDEHGLVDVSRLVPESASSIRILASASGYCRLSRHVQASEWSEGGQATVPMLAGARFEGLVRDAAGDPLAGARVTLPSSGRIRQKREPAAALLLQGWGSSWILGPESEEPVESDAAGRFATGAVPPATSGWRLLVSAEGHTTKHVDPGPAAEPGRSTWVEVSLEPDRSGAISGLLTLNGAPISGQVTWRCAGSGGSGRADPSGRFRLADVGPGEVRLSAVPLEGRHRFGRLCEEQVVSVALAPRTELAQDIALVLPVATTSGYVRTQRGEGVAGAELLAALPERGVWLWANSQEAGRFDLELPTAGDLWMLSVRSPWRSKPVEVRPGERDVVLVMEELGRLRVRLLDAADGEPVRGLEVRGRQPGVGSASPPVHSWQHTPDPEGWVELEAPSGPLDVTLIALERAYPPVSASVSVPPAGADPLRLELYTQRGVTLVLALAEDSDRPPSRSQPCLLTESEAALLSVEGSGEFRWQLLLAGSEDPVGLRRRRISFDSQARTTLLGLPAGRYVLVDLAGGTLAPNRIELPRQAESPITMSWKPSN